MPLSTRRQFLARTALASGALAFGPRALTGEKDTGPRGKAEHCLFIWLGGGMAHLDTFDPKAIRGDGRKQAGSYYDCIDTAIPGVQVCEHLSQVAKIFDRFVPVRTVHHNVIDEHAAAVNRMHTGRPVSGSVVYPSVGSIVAHEKKAAAEGVPPYVLIGYPSATRGPGFLGPKAGYVYLTDTAAGPAGLTRPANITPERAARREALLAGLRADYLQKHSDEPLLHEYDDAIAESFKLQGGEFMRAFALEQEPETVRAAFGDEFGQRCLLGRRLIQRGVRFVEVGFNLNFVNGAGWDTHNAAQKEQHELIKRLDHGVAALVTDLERERLLEKTLIVIATEFGRPAQFDAGGGRGHYGKCFSCVLAGGGLRTGQAVGTTDELAMNIVEEPVSVSDLFATIFAALGINPAKDLMDGERPVPITDQGKPVAKLFG
ncbi:MAG TPA: DUF1501 domain-containing protein [Chthoniobacteraceae bacterium]|jgi:hypothetical protein|nr:DUF1501 domain-containing protein [Chthoniobacteraceae bacterium]